MPKNARKTKLLKKFFLSIAGAMLVAWGISLSAVNANVSFHYEVTNLGTLSSRRDATTSANAINDVGQVVGSSTPTQGFERAFLWQNGKMTGFGPSTYVATTSAESISNNGQVIGNIYDLDNIIYTAFLSRNERVIILDKISEYVYSNAYDINNKGQIVGSSSTYAVLWQNRQLSTLTPLSGYDTCAAYAINRTGTIVGKCTTYKTSVSHAVLWENGKITDLGTLGGASSYASGINDKGQVVGVSYTSAGSTHVFLWQSGKMTDLGAISGYFDRSSLTLAINNKGTVVGNSYLQNGSGGAGRRHAFLWRNSRRYDLNSLIPPNSGWELNVAKSINNRGQIVGNGIFKGQERGFLLTPVFITN